MLQVLSEIVISLNVLNVYLLYEIIASFEQEMFDNDPVTM